MSRSSPIICALACTLLAVATHSPASAAGARAAAAESAAFKKCMKASGGVTARMQGCMGTEYARLDRQLNVTYRSVMKQLKTKQQRTRLVEVQRVWIWRRDNDCLARAKAQGGGGTAGDLIYNDCRIQMVRKRIVWLTRVPANPGYLTKV